MLLAILGRWGENAEQLGHAVPMGQPPEVPVLQGSPACPPSAPTPGVPPPRGPLPSQGVRQPPHGPFRSPLRSGGGHQLSILLTFHNSVSPMTGH